jgi:hypothetical protein
LAVLAWQDVFCQVLFYWSLYDFVSTLRTQGNDADYILRMQILPTTACGFLLFFAGMIPWIVELTGLIQARNHRHDLLDYSLCEALGIL